MQGPAVQHGCVGAGCRGEHGRLRPAADEPLLAEPRRCQLPHRAALTALDALLDAGVTVGAGGDNVQDPFNLVGRSDPLETAALMVMVGHRSPQVAYDMVSNAPRTAMGLAPVNFQVGDPADFVAIDATDTSGRHRRRAHGAAHVHRRPTRRFC